MSVIKFQEMGEFEPSPLCKICWGKPDECTCPEPHDPPTRKRCKAEDHTSGKSLSNTTKQL